MSKKLIAISSIAALALSAFVAMPAQANVTLTADGQNISTTTGVGTSTTTPLTHASPEANELVWTSTSNATNTVVRYTVTTVANKVVTVNATGGVKLVTELTTATNNVNAASGATQLSINSGSSTSVIFYAYTTSTTAGTVAVSYEGSTSSLFLKSGAGGAYNISVKAPSVVGEGATVSLDATITDVFGNTITDTNKAESKVRPFAAASTTVTRTGAVALVGNAATWNTIRKVWEAKVTGSTGGGSAAAAVELTGVTSLTSLGLPAPRTSAFVSLNTTDFATAVAALQAQVAALTADYNALAARWNKKVDSKRTVKKKVALK